MTALWQRIPWLVRSLIALVLAFVAVIVVNYVTTPPTKALFPDDLGAGGLPLTLPAQIVTLVTLFAAGVAGGFVLTLLAPRALAAHAWVFCALAVITDLTTILGSWSAAPLWFKVVMVGTVPLQVWVGFRLALAIRNRRR